MAHIGDRRIDTIHGGGQNASVFDTTDEGDSMMNNGRLPVLLCRRCYPQRRIRPRLFITEHLAAGQAMREHTAAKGT